MNANRKWLIGGLAALVVGVIVVSWAMFAGGKELKQNNLETSQTTTDSSPCTSAKDYVARAQQKHMMLAADLEAVANDAGDREVTATFANPIAASELRSVPKIAVITATVDEFTQGTSLHSTFTLEDGDTFDAAVSELKRSVEFTLQTSITTATETDRPSIQAALDKIENEPLALSSVTVNESSTELSSFLKGHRSEIFTVAFVTNDSALKPQDFGEKESLRRACS